MERVEVRSEYRERKGCSSTLPEALVEEEDVRSMTS